MAVVGRACADAPVRRKARRYVNMRAETLYTPLEMDKDSNDK